MFDFVLIPARIWTVSHICYRRFFVLLSVYFGEGCKMEAVAKHEFHATADDELSFKKGTVVKVNESHKAYHAESPFLNIPT